MDKVNQDTAEALERVARMGNEDEVNHIQSARLKKRESVAGDGAHVRLQVRGAETGIHTGRPPDFNGENVKGSQESARIMNGERRGDQLAALFESANSF
jgi:hypothetical protein